jgi:diguanylate cyclase (GGDEF)-like protein
MCYILLYIIFTLYSNKLINAHKNIHQLKKEVDTDALTGINNRTSLNTYLQNNVKNKNEYAIIFFDIDDFKNINDSYGHDVGDTILKEFANVVTNTIRYDDFFARWGGEEFIIVLKIDTLQKALKLTQKIRKNINSNLFYNSITVTCSFGITMIDSLNDFDSIIKRADKLLYEAKHAGKDCIKAGS